MNSLRKVFQYYANNVDHKWYIFLHLYREIIMHMYFLDIPGEYENIEIYLRNTLGI